MIEPRRTVGAVKIEKNEYLAAKKSKAVKKKTARS